MSRKEEVEEAAYYLSKDGYTYDELCFMLAERLLVESKGDDTSEAALDEDRSESALKFFHSQPHGGSF